MEFHISCGNLSRNNARGIDLIGSPDGFCPGARTTRRRSRLMRKEGRCDMGEGIEDVEYAGNEV